jgi:hypothetical protein
MKPALIAWIAVFSCLPLSGQLQGLHDTATIGTAVGATAAGFSLLDQSGKRHTVESLMGPQGLVLVFFRSADW